MAREKQETKEGFTAPHTVKEAQEMQLPSDREATNEELAEQAAAANALEPVGKGGSAGMAEVPRNTGVVTKATATAKVAKAKNRNIKVQALTKGWFDNKRIKVGDKFLVASEEFSELWMTKI